MDKLEVVDTDISDSSQSSDELSDSSQSSDESSPTTAAPKRKKGLLSKRHIVAVKKALRMLANDDFFVKNSKTKERDFFCIEDTFLVKDLQVSVEGIGQLSFPLDKSSVEQMIKLSSKAKFGKGRKTLLDTSVRDTQTIPASKLKVEINDSLDTLLKRIGVGLNIDKNSRFIPHLHNLLIYGPGQFFKKHTDSEKVENMIATLVMILPFPHEGGELVIEHNKKKHTFFGSNNPDIVKCVAFYSDCAHEIKKVTKGYRIAITYNVVLQPPDNSSLNQINESLSVAVENYFKNGGIKLAFGLNHSYSQHNLKWNLMKGADRPRVNALLAVAKKQGRVPCLALADYHEIYDKESTYYCPEEDPALVVEETTLSFMIDENNKKLPSSNVFNDNYVNTKEFCCTKTANELFEPYKTAASGPTGNEGDTEEFWYRRACVVLWSNKWAFSQGFKEALGEIHQLTKQNGMENDLLRKINQAGENFFRSTLWTEASVAEMLLDIVIYLGDEEKAKMILGELSKHIMKEDAISRLVELEKKFNNQTWCEIVKIWKDKGYCGEWYTAVKSAPVIIDKYIEQVGTQFRSVVVEQLLEEGVKEFIYSDNRRSINNYVYGRKTEECIENLSKLMKVCSLLGKVSLEKILIGHVVESSYPAVSLGELYAKLIDDLKPENLPSYEVIRDLAANAINERLSELENDADWAFPVKVTCKCKACSSILSFFSSNTSRTHMVECRKKSYDHVHEIFISGLKLFSLPCKTSTERNGSKYKISFEKLPKLLKDRQKLFDDLLQFKNKIGTTKNFVRVDVKIENEDNIEMSSLSDYTNIEIEEMKFEPKDWTNDYDELLTSEEVDVKLEVVNYADESETEQKILKKQKKF